MLTHEGCRLRRQRFLERLGTWPVDGPLRLADPIHLMYLVGFHVNPFSLGAGFGGVLLLHRDGSTHLIHDDRLPGSVQASHADERTVVPWYAGQAPGRGPRQLVLQEQLGPAARIHDRPEDPLGATLIGLLAEQRRQKDHDELDVLRRCMRATDAGHAWSRIHVRPGMTELEVYAGIQQACTQAAGRAVIVYGDFLVCPGPSRRVGPPNDRVIQPGDMLLLDFSVVIDGYRSDFTNTLVVGREPTPDQRRFFDLCVAAMAAGEQQLREGAACLDVYQAVRGVFEREQLGEAFPHHAGHGLGLTHPEAPFFVRAANESLRKGDVVTLEPGLYREGLGGIRIEHNYLITATGFERLSNHAITLTPR